VFNSSCAWSESVCSDVDERVAALEGAVRAGKRLSADELAAARREIASTNAALADALAENRATNTKLAAIEDHLLGRQSASSDVGKAKARVSALRKEVDQQMHRVLSLPPHATPPTELDYVRETSNLTKEQQEALAGDGRFQESVQELVKATQKLVAAKHALFEKNEKWKAARDAGRRTLAVPHTGDVAADANATIKAARDAVDRLRGHESAGGKE
jgi:hypothetical protein